MTPRAVHPSSQKSLGSVHSAQELTRVVFEALRRAGVRAIVAEGAQALFPLQHVR